MRDVKVYLDEHSGTSEQSKSSGRDWIGVLVLFPYSNPIDYASLSFMVQKS